MNEHEIDATKHRNSIQGVTRITDAAIMNDIIQSHPDILSWIIVTEKQGTNDEHTHFLIQGETRQLNVSAIRTFIKDQFSEMGLAPAEYLNGMLNISRCRDPPRMITYLLKEHMPNYYHGFLVETLKHFKEHSFEKKVSMTYRIGKLKEQFYLSQIELEDYIFSYRKIRIEYKKPDLNWRADADRVTEIVKSDDLLRREIATYLENKNNPYY